MKKYKCPCCGFLTLESENEYDICRVCFWEDDPYQREDETLAEGANKISLAEARSNYLAFGACEQAMRQYVRRPHTCEIPPDEE